MNERLKVLLARQDELDNFIIKSQGIEPLTQDLFLNRLVAATVEMAEFANELRFFKHWSNKGASARSVYLEEYVDLLHFLLSLTNQVTRITGEFVDVDFDYDTPKEAESKVIMARLINEDVLFFNAMIADLYTSYCVDEPKMMVESLKVAWNIFIEIGVLLQMSNDEVESAYNAKYEKNIERQKSGY